MSEFMAGEKVTYASGGITRITVTRGVCHHAPIVIGVHEMFPYPGFKSLDLAPDQAALLHGLLGQWLASERLPSCAGPDSL